uniref:Uncharacterized protein n=1 Tax=Anguilla anguilla TaxID=7936 RepID=A0A0E9QBR7_ANGAN
MPGCRSDTQ